MQAIVILPLVAGFLAPVPQQPVDGQTAAAPGEVSIHAMEVDIWPEYDDPRVLVIYSGAVDTSVVTPVQFSFVVPRGAQIHMAGAVGENGEHLHGLYETRPRDSLLTEVRYELATPNFYMEFYYDPFGGGGEKRFEYPLVSPYPVSQLVVRVQQPLEAREFQTVPVALDVIEDTKGFSYSRFLFEGLAANEAKAVAVSYVKPDRKPSVVQAGSEPAGGGAMKVIVLIGAVALASMIAYGLFAAAMRKRARLAAVGGRQMGGARAPADGAARDAEHKYCVECGTQMLRSDKFCPECGASSAAGVTS